MAVYLTTEQASTPSNPASGYSKLYPKTDGYWYWLDDSGTEHRFVSADLQVVNETPGGTMDGVNTTFTLANTPSSGTVAFYYNGQRLKYNSGSGGDFTVSGTNVTLTTAPIVGDTLIVDYRKA